MFDPEIHNSKVLTSVSFLTKPQFHVNEIKEKIKFLKKHEPRSLSSINIVKNECEKFDPYPGLTVLTPFYDSVYFYDNVRGWDEN